MPWFRVDDTFYMSRKVLRIPRPKRAAAIGLWLLAGAWCAHELTDGRIDFHEVDELGGRAVDAEALVAAGLWERIETGYLFHDWADYQPTRASVLEARSKEAERKRAARRPRGHTPDVQEDGDNSPAGVLETSGRSPVGQDPESGDPVPSRPVPGLTDTTHDRRQSYETDARAMAEGLTTGQRESLESLHVTNPLAVITSVLKHVDRPITGSQLVVLCADLITKAGSTVKNPQRYIVSCIEQSWPEIQKFLDEEVA